MAADTVTNLKALFPKGFRHGVGAAASVTNTETVLDSYKPQYTESITVDSATVPKIIDDDTSHVQVTSSNATYALQLPTAVAGKKVTINIGANGCELWATGSSVKINDVICSATNEAAIPADTFSVCYCRSSTEWILTNYTKLGAVTTAIVPDSR